MNDQPDKFFRDKLNDFQPPVSAGAWNRVSRNLGRKSDQRVWLKVAAGLLLLAAAGMLIFPLQQDDPALHLSENTPPVKKQESAPPEKSISEQSEANVQKEIHTSPVAAGPQDAGNTKRWKQKKEGPRPVPAAEPLPAEQNAIATTETPLPDHAGIAEEPRPETPRAPAAAPQAEKENITIVFTAQEVNEKYLKKKNGVAKATPKTKDSSTWQKLLDKAYDLKHNQDPLGNLRQKKNEILALNFKNDKQSHDN